MTSERTRMRATTLVVGVALALILIPMVFDEPATDYQTLTVAGSGPLSSERVMALQAEIQQPLGQSPTVVDFDQAVPSTDLIDRVRQLASEVDADGYNAQDGTRFGEPILQEMTESSRVLAVLVDQSNDVTEARALREQMRGQGYEAFISAAKLEVGGENSSENIVHRVAIGPLLSHTEAEEMRDDVSRANNVNARVVEMSQ
jgi:cell division septation protein DedD